jgi:hypothetical protein
MKTPKQIETVEFAKAYLMAELDKLDDLAKILVKIMNGHEPLLGDSGPGNTHGDNLEIRAYGKLVADQIRLLIYSPLMSNDERTKWRIHLYETYFSDREIVAWRDLLSGII